MKPTLQGRFLLFMAIGGPPRRMVQYLSQCWRDDRIAPNSAWCLRPSEMLNGVKGDFTRRSSCFSLRPQFGQHGAMSACAWVNGTIDGNMLVEVM